MRFYIFNFKYYLVSTEKLPNFKLLLKTPLYSFETSDRFLGESALIFLKEMTVTKILKPANNGHVKDSLVPEFFTKAYLVFLNYLLPGLF